MSNHIVSIIPTGGDRWAITLTIDPGLPSSITPFIGSEDDFRTASKRAVALIAGLHTSGSDDVRVAVVEEKVRCVVWDDLYASVTLTPDAVIVSDIPQGALDAIALLGGAR